VSNHVVLRVNLVEEETAFLGAVHDVIRCILAEKDGRTLIDIAEAAGVHPTTFSRWKLSDRNPDPFGASMKSLSAIFRELDRIEAPTPEQAELHAA
jgi:hypothetical protein